MLELDVGKTDMPYAYDTTVAPFSTKSLTGVQKRYDFSDGGRTARRRR